MEETKEISYPRKVAINVKWRDGKYKSYYRTVVSERHLNNSIDRLESNNGKVVGVIDKD